MIILSIYTTFVEHRTAIRSAARATMVSPFWTQSADLPKSSLSDVSAPLLWPLSFRCHPLDSLSAPKGWSTFPRAQGTSKNSRRDLPASVLQLANLKRSFEIKLLANVFCNISKFAEMLLFFKRNAARFCRNSLNSGKT